MSKLFPKAVSRSYFPKLFPKIPLQSGCTKAIMLQTYSPQLFSKAAPESCSPQLLPKTAPQNCVLKLLPKGTPHSKLLFKAAPPQSCSASKLLSLPRKVISESGFPKLLSKAIPQSYRFSKQLSVNAAFKAAKLLPAVIPQSCSSKLLPKAASEKRSPKLQCYYPKLPQSWSGWLSKVAPQSFFLARARCLSAGLRS